MPSEELPAEERENPSPSLSSSSSGNASQEVSIDYHPNNNNGNNGNDDEGQRVQIMNVRNNSRNGLNNRPLRFMERLHLAAPARYYPIIIPSEPTIEELLVRYIFVVFPCERQ